MRPLCIKSSIFIQVRKCSRKKIKKKKAVYDLDVGKSAPMPNSLIFIYSNISGLWALAHEVFSAFIGLALPDFPMGWLLLIPMTQL